MISIARRVTSVDVSPQFDNYSKVIIHVSEDTTYEVGNDTGRTLELTNPFGTQAMAENILASLTGYQYQPYEAKGALLDPSAEIGDAVNMRGAYGGIYTRERSFGRLMKADVSAPQDEEINHEFQYESPERREFTRAIGEVKASLIIANDRIDATVSQTGGDASTFGWSMNATGHRWYANGQEVMAVTASGLKVTGEVQATTGKIGGFSITATSLFNNLPYYGATQSNGVYIGGDGIQLGQGFFVNSAGQCLLNSLTANNATINGTLNVGGNVITAYQLSSGAGSAYSNGGYWSGGAAGGYGFTNATQGNGPSTFSCGTLYNTGANIYVRGRKFTYKNTTIGGVTIEYLGLAS